MNQMMHSSHSQLQSQLRLFSTLFMRCSIETFRSRASASRLSSGECRFSLPASADSSLATLAA